METNVSSVVVGKVSVSQLNTFSSCQRKWFFSRVNKFKTNINFMFGSAYHKSLEALKFKYLEDATLEGVLYLKGHGFIELLQSNYDAELYSKDEIIEMANNDFKEWQSLLENMVERYNKFLNDNGFKIHMSEIELNYVINKEIRLQCFIDRILEKDGKYYLEESKSGRDVNLSHVPIDFQAGVYVTIAEKVLDIPIEGLVYTKNKKSIPNAPKVLKSGALSTDKSQSTTYELYMGMAKSIYGDNIPDEVLVCAEEILNKKGYFDYRFLTKNKEQKTAILNQLKLKGKELVKAQKILATNEKKAFSGCSANYNKDCIAMCDYYNDCMKADGSI